MRFHVRRWVEAGLAAVLGTQVAASAEPDWVSRGEPTRGEAADAPTVVVIESQDVAPPRSTGRANPAPIPQPAADPCEQPAYLPPTAAGGRAGGFYAGAELLFLRPYLSDNTAFTVITPSAPAAPGAFPVAI